MAAGPHPTPPASNAQSFEHVLANINKLNRNLEAVIAVGNEFSSVEALWSTFENVMGKEEQGESVADKGSEGAQGAEEQGEGSGDEHIEVEAEQMSS